MLDPAQIAISIELGTLIIGIGDEILRNSSTVRAIYHPKNLLDFGSALSSSQFMSKETLYIITHHLTTETVD